METPKLLGKTLIYGVGGFLPIASRILLFPLFVQYLSPTDYGVLALCSVLGELLVVVFPCGLIDAYARYYFDARNDRDELDRYLACTTIWIFAASTVMFCIFVAVGPFVLPRIVSSGGFVFFPYGLLCGVWAVGEVVRRLATTHLRNEEKPLEFVAVSAATLLLALSGEITSVVFLDSGCFGVVLARTASSIVVALLCLPMLLRFHSLELSRSMKTAFFYGIPIAIYSILGLAARNADRVVVAGFLTVHDLGIFNVAFTVVFTCEVALIALQNAIYPSIYRELGSNNKLYVAKALRVFGILMLIFIAFILAIGPAYIRWAADPRYEMAAPLIPVILIGMVARYYFAVYALPLFYHERTRALPFINAFTACFSILGNVVAVAQFGILGAAIVATLSQIVPAFCAWAASRAELAEETYSLRYIHAGSMMIVLSCCLSAMPGYLHFSVAPLAIFAVFGLLISPRVFSAELGPPHRGIFDYV